MRRLTLAQIAITTLLLTTACGAASNEPSIGDNESNYTSDASASNDTSDSDASSSSSPVVEVAPFTLADVGSQAKLRFSIDGATPVDAAQAEWTTTISGDRRFHLQGATPAPGGKPAFYVEFGRGQAWIEKGTYDCAELQALALIVDADGTKKLTLVQGAPQRACKVVVDDLREVVPTTSPRGQPWREVVGHVEAIVGPREDGAALTKTIRASFAVTVFEMQR